MLKRPERSFGAKGAGERLTNPTAAALENAVFHAPGVCIKELSITPEKILRALKKKKEKQNREG